MAAAESDGIDEAHAHAHEDDAPAESDSAVLCRRAGRAAACPTPKETAADGGRQARPDAVVEPAGEGARIRAISGIAVIATAARSSQ